MSEVKLLTSAAIEKYKPTKTVREIKDAATMGLYLTIHPTGTKVWAMKLTRPDGRSGHLTLGRVDVSRAELEGEPVIGMPLSLSAARLLAAKVHRDRKMGKDVIAEFQAQKHRQRLQVQDDATNSFASAAKEFIEKYAKKNQRRWKDTAVALGWNFTDEAEPVMTRGGLAERWATKPAREIDDADIFSVVREAGESGVPGCAKRTKGHSDARERAVFAALSGLYRWLKAERKVPSNPCLNAVELAPFNKRDRTLSDDEIRWLWNSSVEEGAPFGNVFCLLLLTGQRLNEIAGMQRAELYDDALNLPGSRTKNHRAHAVPLCQAARDLIPSGDTDFVFTTTGTTPISGWSTAKSRLDAAMLKLARKEKGKAFIIPHWTLHDLRRTAVTGMRRLGIPSDVVERTINHVSGYLAGVAGIYDHADLMPERTVALQRWSDHIHGLVQGMGTNVVPIKRETKA